jgi:hypothetical protein
MRHISTNIGVKTGFFLRVFTHFYRGLYGFFGNGKNERNFIDKEADKVFDQIRNYEKTGATQQLTF